RFARERSARRRRITPRRGLARRFAIARRNGRHAAIARTQPFRLHARLETIEFGAWRPHRRESGARGLARLHGGVAQALGLGHDVTETLETLVANRVALVGRLAPTQVGGRPRQRRLGRLRLVAVLGGLGVVLGAKRLIVAGGRGPGGSG